jgi:hypothetical protein
MIVAKAVIPNQYWILQQDDRKIGNIQAAADGFTVVINGSQQKFKTLRTIRSKVSIDFQSIPRSRDPNKDNTVLGYATDAVPYNGVFDVPHRVPLWTREPRSKSWYAAGWYLIRHGRAWQSEFCPKMIMLNRNEFLGPFHTEEEALTHEPAHQQVY